MTDQEKIAALMKERDEWREACLGHGEKAHALEATVSALTRKLEEAKGALQWYVDTDETNEGGHWHWDGANAFWIEGRNRAKSSPLPQETRPMASETKIGELLERVRKATGPDRSLDYDLFVLFAIPETSNHWCPRSGNEFTSSVDNVLSLADRLLPGAFYLFGKGRVSAKEPLYACQFLFGADEVLGEAEHDRLALAILAALLAALSAPEKAEAVETQGRDEVLIAFHEECDIPTRADVERWTQANPSFAQDIREHAAIRLATIAEAPEAVETGEPVAWRVALESIAHWEIDPHEGALTAYAMKEEAAAALAAIPTAGDATNGQ